MLRVHGFDVRVIVGFVADARHSLSVSGNSAGTEGKNQKKSQQLSTRKSSYRWQLMRWCACVTRVCLSTM